MEQTAPPFFNRGPSLLTRLAFYAVLSLVLLYTDARFHYLESLRKVVAVVVYPLQQVVAMPGSAWDSVLVHFSTLGTLKQENEELRRTNRLDAGLLQTQQSLLEENDHLRRLLDVRSQYQQRSVAAEILYTGRDPFSRKVMLDVGNIRGIEEGAAVVDEKGLVGQITRLYAWVAEVSLITDRDQAVPVQVVRNGLRAVTFGQGSDGTVELRFMPANADIQNGDVLVTSGIDGTYPSGLPVGVVTAIERNPAFPFARIVCAPSAGVHSHRHVLILSRPEAAPEYPIPAEDPAKKITRKPRRTVTTP
jgi:rod shape-determining protein MreC